MTLLDNYEILASLDSSCISERRQIENHNRKEYKKKVLPFITPTVEFETQYKHNGIYRFNELLDALKIDGEIMKEFEEIINEKVSELKKYSSYVYIGKNDMRIISETNFVAGNLEEKTYLVTRDKNMIRFFEKAKDDTSKNLEVVGVKKFHHEINR